GPSRSPKGWAASATRAAPSLPDSQEKARPPGASGRRQLQLPEPAREFEERGIADKTAVRPQPWFHIFGRSVPRLEASGQGAGGASKGIGTKGDRAIRSSVPGSCGAVRSPVVPTTDPSRSCCP